MKTYFVLRRSQQNLNTFKKKQKKQRSKSSRLWKGLVALVNTQRVEWPEVQRWRHQ